MKFGDNLRKLRKSKKISQEKLAEKIGVSRQSVSKWECGDAYPEMKHIMDLCKILKCHINDLVHEDFSDIDSLDEDIRVNIVKFKREKQLKMKRLSRNIYIIARIGKILSMIGLVVVIATMIILPIAGSKLNIEENYIIFNGHHYSYEIDDINRLSLYDGDKKMTINIDSKTSIKEYMKNVSMTELVFNGEIIAVSIAITVGFVILLLQNLEKLFINIYEGDTPFTLENVQFIKKIAMYIALVIVFPFVSGILFALFSHIDMNIEFEMMSAVIVLIVFSMAYIFEYGYEIQLDSKGRMYGDENE